VSAPTRWRSASPASGEAETAGPGDSNQAAGATPTPSPAWTRWRTVSGSEISNSGTGLKPAQLAGGDDRLAQAAARLGEDERSLGERGQRDGPAGARVVLGQHREHRLVGERLGGQAGGRVAVEPGDADVRATGRDQRDHLGGRRVAQRHLQARMLAVEDGERLREPGRVDRRRGHAHAPAGETGVAVDLLARAGQLGQRRLGVDEQVLARRRRLRAARGPPQQRHPELGLEPADLLGERGLGDPQRVGRARELAMPRDRDEVLELAELHPPQAIHNLAKGVSRLR
jgi:hypothetical protein